MSFQISSEKIGNPLLIELLKTVTDCFEGIGLPFYVIGATARDIIMRQLIDTASARRTRDLDIAIAIPDWGKFDEAAARSNTNGFIWATMSWMSYLTAAWPKKTTVFIGRWKRRLPCR